jgi:hypothetical protein
MANLAVTAASIRPLAGSITVRAVADEALTVGDVVYISGTSDNKPKVSKNIETAIATGNIFGIVTANAVDAAGSTSVADEATIDVTVFGPIEGIAGTAGGFIWGSDTAGKLEDAVGTKSCIAGVMLSSSIFFLNPMQATRAA